MWHKGCRDSIDACKLERARQRALKKRTAEPSTSHSVKTRRLSSAKEAVPTKNCFFCEEDDSKDDLHAVETLELDEMVRESTDKLQDETLIRKLSAGDMVALECCYHLRCLVLFKRKANHVHSGVQNYSTFHAM